MASAKGPKRGSAARNANAPPADKRWHVHVDGKTYGPYDVYEISQMVERHQIIGSDLVHAHDGTEWVKVASDPILGTLFRHQEHASLGTQLAVRASGFRQHRAKILMGGAAVIAALWIVWPYYAAYSLFTAFRDGDVSVLEDRVAWNSVREGIRGDMNAMFLATIAADANKNDASPTFGAGFAAMLGPAIINQVVDGYVTPQAIAAAKHAETSNSFSTGIGTDAKDNLIVKGVQQADRLRLDQVRYAFFSGPLTFRVDVLPERDPPLRNPVTLVFKWTGDWKLTRIVLPADLRDAIQATRTLPAQDTQTPNLSKTTEPIPISEQLAQAQSALNDLRTEKELLAQIEITKSHFTFEKLGFLEQPTISLTIANKSTIPIKRIFVHGKLQTPGRSVPWVERDFNYEITGGLEPQETQNLELNPNTFSDWGNVPRDAVRGAVLNLTLIAFEDAAGKRYGDDATKTLVDKIQTLQDKINDMKTQLNQGG